MRWQKWCSYIDNNNANNNSTQNIATLIGQAIAAVIAGTNKVSQIEFYAVPDNGTNMAGNSVGVVTPNYQEQNGDVTLVILKNTQTIDNLK